MQRNIRQNTIWMRTAVILAVVISITVLVVVVIVPGFGSVRVNPAPPVLYGRWIKRRRVRHEAWQYGHRRRDSFAGHMDSELAMRMKLASIGQKLPDGLELKLQSYAKAEFVMLTTLMVKDATTIVNGAGIWLKCP